MVIVSGKSMTKKSFVVILILSIIFWIISAFLQGFLGTLFNFNLLAGSCQVTGYPLAFCINSYGGLPIGYYLLNIMLWFVIIWGIWKVLQKSKSKK